MKNKLILFIHGLGGSAKKTWGNFPELLKFHSVIGKTHKIEVWEYSTGAIGKEPDHK